MKLRVGIAGVFCFVIGLVFVSQYGAAQGPNVYVSARSIEGHRISIENEKNEIENIRGMIDNAREQLARYEEARDEGDFSEILDELAAELLKYRMFSGYETVQGSGVRIILDDGTRPLHEWENINILLVHDIDIITIINDLRRNGAEAISVNGQRIIDRTEISCAGYTVRINRQVFARPFVIKAIGNGSRMSASLISPEGYGTLLQQFGVQFSVELLEEMTIPGHTSRPMDRFMTSTTS